MRYVIRFDFSGDTLPPVYAGEEGGEPVVVPRLDEATRFADAEEAARSLASGYGNAARFGTVIEEVKE